MIHLCCNRVELTIHLEEQEGARALYSSTLQPLPAGIKVVIPRGKPKRDIITVKDNNHLGGSHAAVG